MTSHYDMDWYNDQAAGDVRVHLRNAVARAYLDHARHLTNAGASPKRVIRILGNPEEYLRGSRFGYADFTRIIGAPIPKI